MFSSHGTLPEIVPASTCSPTFPTNVLLFKKYHMMSSASLNASVVYLADELEARNCHHAVCILLWI